MCDKIDDECLQDEKNENNGDNDKDGEYDENEENGGE